MAIDVASAIVGHHEAEALLVVEEFDLSIGHWATGTGIASAASGPRPVAAAKAIAAAEAVGIAAEAVAAAESVTEAVVAAVTIATAIPVAAPEPVSTAMTLVTPGPVSAEAVSARTRTL